ncbi:zinc finger CCHC domain-containing protein 7-like isoform X1 [Anguilla rostrata]|uniref:zinc finger CCHC domain-containing protein 7-like isoform X1 n=1 Tax=Anguilla rostrata TaxID=7938 RepID=UPI0030CAE7B1
MSTGYQEEEEYEDELYREDEGSLSSGAESEAEVWLYSQLHYSTGLGQREEEDDGEEGQRRGETGDEEGACPAAGRDPNTQRSPGQQWSSDRDSDPDPDSDGVESWMILDGEEQEGDCNILLNVEVRGSSSSSSNSSAEDGNNAHDWTVSEKDMEAQIGSRCPSLQRTYRYYNATKSVACQNCRRTGHFSRDCPGPKKRPSCLLCGDEGHLQHACPHRYCPNCCLPGHGFEDCLELAYWHKRCHRCGVAGHFHDACPDIWRQYHLTTQTGTLVKPDRMDAHRNSAYCYNCARRGHFGFACSQRRMSSGIYPNVPYVSRYDSTQDVCQRDSRVQKKAKELQDAGLLVLPPDPQGGDREESPTGKRKKHKGGGGKEAKGATPGARKGERQPGRGKTWPEKRKERRQIKKLRREAMAQRAGATGPALLEEEEEEEERLFLRGPERIPSGTATPPVKGKASPGLFGSGKCGDWKNRKCRDRKCRDRKCRERKSAKGRKQGALKHEDVYPSDENFLSVKRKARHRKR